MPVRCDVTLRYCKLLLICLVKCDENTAWKALVLLIRNSQVPVAVDIRAWHEAML